MGGTRRKDAGAPSNLLRLCGSGTTGDHGWIERHRAEAYERGLLVRQHETPAAVPVLLRVGWVLLDDAGHYLPAERGVA
jgi:hypothetical protein